MTMLDHPLTWASPRPLWRAAGQAGMQPAILRFARDDFADQLLGAMTSDPGAIANFVARYEDWRTPAAQTQTPDLAQRIPLPATIKQNRRAFLRKEEPTPIKEAVEDTPLLKLYQPAHQRHYVATATLACATSGLPDRALGGAHERVGMLLRRLMPASKDGGEVVEYAWILGDEPRWQKVSDTAPEALAPGEEMLPVFPMGHVEGDNIKRKTWGGTIPVARREDYLSAPVTREAVSLVEGQRSSLLPVEPVLAGNSTQARLSEFRMDVAEPWKATIRALYKEVQDLIESETIPDEVNRSDLINALRGPKQVQLRERNYQLQMQSWLLLLDFGRFLERHTPNLPDRLQSGSTSGLSDGETNLLNWLRNTPAQTRLIDGMGNTDKDHAESMADALHRVLQPGIADLLESVETEYSPDPSAIEAARWPDFHYLLAGIGSDGDGGGIELDGPFEFTTGLPAADDESQIVGPGNAALAAANAQAQLVDRLMVLVGRALPTSNEAEARRQPFAERLSKVMEDTAGDEGLFCIRFVHVNEDCGPLHPPTLSQPTELFRMASFFDPDAPAREIKIMLPRDTSAAGLRKHSRGTAFVMSDMLCGQVQRAKGLGLIDLIRQVLPWPLHKDIDMGAGGGCKSGENRDIGMICSLSIPIVTLCALILLMIIVQLLDFIFKWVPWLIACFPLPNFKAKEGST